jgi:hypothetical protein
VIMQHGPSADRSGAEWATGRLRRLAERLGAPVANFDLVALGAPDPARPRLGLDRGISTAVLRHAPGTVLLSADAARILQVEPACSGHPMTAAASSTH